MHFFESGGFMALGGLWMVLWWVLVIVGTVAFVRWIGRTDSPRQNQGALEIIKERYARGEIDQQEFQKKMRELGG